MSATFEPIENHLNSSGGATGEAMGVVDVDSLLSQKENIRPLVTGRSASTLSNLFNKSQVDAERVLREGHEYWRGLIKEAERAEEEGSELPGELEGCDGLEAYVRYIAFINQNHPSSLTHLLPILESVTRKFLPDPRYAQDIRYLKLWVQFSKLVERPEDIWAFLNSKEVGTRHAIFYEEWANTWEAKGRREKADECFRIGIARKAQPLKRLQTSYTNFQGRPPVVPTEERPASTSMATPSSSGPRKALASRTPLNPQALSSSSGPALRTPKNGSRLDVFADNDRKGQDAASSEWEDLGSRDGNRKENVVEAVGWKGETLPQSAKIASRIAPRTPKMEVFKDEGSKSVMRSAEDQFSRGRMTPNEAKSLRADPLRFYGASTDLSKSSSIDKLPIPAPPPSNVSSKRDRPVFTKAVWTMPDEGRDVPGKNGKIERRMIEWDQVFRDGDEWCFEEIRARRMADSTRVKEKMQDWERSWHAPGTSTPKPVKIEPKKSIPSPTVNTKAAMADVYELFNQTVHSGTTRRAESSDDDDDSSDEESDEDDDVGPQSIPQPTPIALNASSGYPARQAIGLSTPGPFVPPTPTPAQGHLLTRKQDQLVNRDDALAEPAGNPGGAPLVFRDENAVPASAKKIGIFTPMKQSLSEKTPLKASTSSSSNVFAQTPLHTSHPVRRGIFQEQVLEETEEPKEDIEEENPRRIIRCGGAFDLMTPITERTCEFTTSSQAFTLRSSLGGQRPSTVPEDESGDEAGATSQVTTASAFREVSPPVDDPTTSQFASTSRSPSIDRSQRSPFALSPGHTIHNKSDRDTVFVRDDQGPLAVTTVSEVAEGIMGSASRFPNPCCPTDPDIIQTLVSSLEPPVSQLPGFIDMRHACAGRLDDLQKRAKTKQRRSSTASSRRDANTESEPWLLTLGEQRYEILEKIGEGGFGAVFKAIDLLARDAADDQEDDEDLDESTWTLAIKVETPANLWEAIILDRLRNRLNQEIQASIIRSRGIFCYADETMLLLDYQSQGTLLNAVNKAQSLGLASLAAGATAGVDELLAIFFTIELLRTVESLHRAGFIHGDLKIDNCLIRLEDVDGSWMAQYSRSGEKGWSQKGIKLIDFGRAIDLSMYPAGQTFVADWTTDARDCQEMREGKAWSYQTDYAGLASICYCMLFGKYICTEAVPGEPGRYRIQGQLKRYWQTDLWNSLFDLLLNPVAVGQGRLPLSDDLAKMRVQFEDWLEANCLKGGKSLKGMLTKIELADLSK